MLSLSWGGISSGWLLSLSWSSLRSGGNRGGSSDSGSTGLGGLPGSNGQGWKILSDKVEDKGLIRLLSGGDLSSESVGDDSDLGEIESLGLGDVESNLDVVLLLLWLWEVKISQGLFLGVPASNQPWEVDVGSSSNSVVQGVEVLLSNPSRQPVVLLSSLGLVGKSREKSASTSETAWGELVDVELGSESVGSQEIEERFVGDGLSQESSSEVSPSLMVVDSFVHIWVGWSSLLHISISWNWWINGSGIGVLIGSSTFLSTFVLGTFTLSSSWLTSSGSITSWSGLWGSGWDVESTLGLEVLKDGFELGNGILGLVLASVELSLWIGANLLLEGLELLTDFLNDSGINSFDLFFVGGNETSLSSDEFGRFGSLVKVFVVGSEDSVNWEVVENLRSVSSKESKASNVEVSGLVSSLI